jgi:uncharacterized protein (TIGR02147 family)
MQTGTQSLFDYLDYREFLRDFYLEQKRKNSSYSFRFLAQKTNVDPAHIARVFQLKRHLSDKSLAPFIQLCKFSEEERTYFDRLVAFNLARTEREAKQAFETLISLSSVKSHTLRPDQYAYYTHWYFTAVRALISMRPFKVHDAGAIAKMLSPPISLRQARDAVNLLLKLGLVNKGDDGTLQCCDTHVTTGPTWRSFAAKTFQAETIRLAAESLDAHPKELRDISTVTVGIKRERMEEMRQKIADFRKSIMHLAEEDLEPDDIFQLNIQLFPLTDIGGREKAL